MPLEISERTKGMGTENAFVVLAEVNKMLSEGKDVVSFCIGQPDFPTPKNIRDACKKALDDGRTGYTASAGIPELRKAVAGYFSKTRHINVEPESVVVDCGGKPFIMYTIACVTQPYQGQEVIYPNPGYPIYLSQTIAQGAKPIPLPLVERKAYAFDIEDLKKRMNDKTRLLILNTPQNPTGGILKEDDLYQIAEVVEKYPKCWIYSDEIYSEIIYEGEFHSIASLKNMQERTIIAHGLSKTYSMTGWRIGFISNARLAKYISTWVTNITACAPHMNQWAAVEALNGPQDEAKKMADKFKERRDLIVKGLNSIPGFKCLSPGGAFYAWPNVTEACKIVGAKNSEELRKRLLNESLVAALSDDHFGSRNQGEGEHLRFSYATSNEQIKEGIKRVKEFMEKNKR